jgi:hypothetical protein
MRFAAKAARGSVRLGRFATLHSHGSLHPQFVGPAKPTVLLIRAAKPSHTAGTLCAIGIKNARRFNIKFTQYFTDILTNYEICIK